MLAKYFLIIRNYVLSVSLQRKYSFYHQNTLLDVFRTNSRNIIGRNPSIRILLLANCSPAISFILFLRPTNAKDQIEKMILNFEIGYQSSLKSLFSTSCTNI